MSVRGFKYSWLWPRLSSPVRFLKVCFHLVFFFCSFFLLLFSFSFSLFFLFVSLFVLWWWWWCLFLLFDWEKEERKEGGRKKKRNISPLLCLSFRLPFILSFIFIASSLSFLSFFLCPYSHLSFFVVQCRLLYHSSYDFVYYVFTVRHFIFILSFPLFFILFFFFLPLLLHCFFYFLFAFFLSFLCMSFVLLPSLFLICLFFYSFFPFLPLLSLFLVSFFFLYFWFLSSLIFLSLFLWIKECCRSSTHSYQSTVRTDTDAVGIRPDDINGGRSWNNRHFPRQYTAGQCPLQILRVACATLSLSDSDSSRKAHITLQPWYHWRTQPLFY